MKKPTVSQMRFCVWATGIWSAVFIALWGKIGILAGFAAGIFFTWLKALLYRKK